MGADCKSAGVRLRGFESLPAHQRRFDMAIIASRGVGSLNFAYWHRGTVAVVSARVFRMVVVFGC